MKESEDIITRTKFFVQYWGVECLYVGKGLRLQEVGNGGWNLRNPDFHLKLKPISSITDEDADLLSSSAFSNVRYNRESYLGELDIFDFFIQEEADILRSRGYLVRVKEYSVEQLVEFGWVKLI